MIVCHACRHTSHIEPVQRSTDAHGQILGKLYNWWLWSSFHTPQQWIFDCSYSTCYLTLLVGSVYFWSPPSPFWWNFCPLSFWKARIARWGSCLEFLLVFPLPSGHRICAWLHRMFCSPEGFWGLCYLKRGVVSNYFPQLGLIVNIRIRKWLTLHLKLCSVLL